MYAHDHRLRRLVDPTSGRTIIAPIDDSLIKGPFAGLERLPETIGKIAAGSPTALLAFSGQFARAGDEISRLAWIYNLTASTVGTYHTRKQQIQSVLSAVATGCDAVAVHVNVFSKHESEMLASMGKIIEEARGLGIPVLAIVYPRTEGDDGTDDNFLRLKSEDIDGFADLVAHCARIAHDMGASMIKTVYTGSSATFARVVAAADSVPVVIAGGPLIDELHSLSIAHDALSAGATGISFGRNVFSRADPTSYLRALGAVVHLDMQPSEALARTAAGAQDTLGPSNEQ